LSFLMVSMELGNREWVMGNWDSNLEKMWNGFGTL